jgi:hypothetical protein
MVALVFGQSNAGNNGESPGTAQRGVYEYYRGQLLEARDPSPSASTAAISLPKDSIARRTFGSKRFRAAKPDPPRP